jgi:hypothetical protein
MKTAKLGISLVAALALPIALAANRATEAPTTTHTRLGVTAASKGKLMTVGVQTQNVAREIKIYPSF